MVPISGLSLSWTCGLDQVLTVVTIGRADLKRWTSKYCLLSFSLNSRVTNQNPQNWPGSSIYR